MSEDKKFKLGLRFATVLLLIACAVSYVMIRHRRTTEVNAALKTARAYVGEIDDYDLSIMSEEHLVGWNTIEISYYSSPPVLGGDIHIVIDRTTGKIVDTRLGQ